MEKKQSELAQTDYQIQQSDDGGRVPKTVPPTLLNRRVGCPLIMAMVISVVGIFSIGITVYCFKNEEEIWPFMEIRWGIEKR